MSTRTLAETMAPGAVHMVPGAHHRAFAARLSATIRVIEHAEWIDGLGSRLATGIAALDTRCVAAPVLLADQVALLIKASTVDRL